MSTANQEFINKAVITTDAIASAGGLNPAQANRFIDFVVDETRLAATGIRTERFLNEKWDVDKINVANRVALAAAEAADPGRRRGVTHSKVTLQPKDIMVPFEISDLYKRHNIEGDSVEEHVIRMMARRAANNIEELFWDGNALGPADLESNLVEGGSSTLYVKDTYLALFDGLLKQAESGHTYNAANGRMDPTRFGGMLRQMPNKFRKGENLRHYLGYDHEQHYREGVATRATDLGDITLQGATRLKVYGVTWEPISLLDANPLYVENVTMTGVVVQSLTHAPVASVVVTTSTLGNAPEAAYTSGVDYTLDAANGTIVRIGGGSIGDGQVVKVTYRTSGRTLLTDPRNIIAGFGLDITIEKDRNIYKRVNEYAIHISVDIKFEETDATVLMRNVLLPT